MQGWLYQMTVQDEWGPAEYRAEAWQGAAITWPTGRITGGKPDLGDLLVLFFAPTRNPSPGVYGLGIVTKLFLGREHFEFELCPPSDYLKTDPLWDAEVERLMDHIRGPMKQGTMWPIDTAALTSLQTRIRSYVGAA